MRITTRMLNESARKAGLPINHTSLLNYINNDSSDNTLLSALNKKGRTMADTESKNRFEKLEKAADQLLQRAEVFTKEGENSVFAKAKESGSNQELYDAAETLVKQYNDTTAALNSASGTLNNYYRQMLKEAASENSEALKDIGITIAKDGTLVLDRDKLKAADTDTLEKVLGTPSTFSAKTAFLAARISQNAQANAESVTSQYSSAGMLYSASASKYDFWG